MIHSRLFLFFTRRRVYPVATERALLRVSICASRLSRAWHHSCTPPGQAAVSPYLCYSLPDGGLWQPVAYL